MTLSFDALQRRTIQEVWEWYRFQADVLSREKLRILTGGVPIDARFFAMTSDDVESFFRRHQDELDFLAMLSLMSATEAALRLDYLERTSRKMKDDVARRFRSIERRLKNNKKANSVKLEEHILDTWAALKPDTKTFVGDFKGALKLRHWLAHGRYWHPKLGKHQYLPGDVFDIVTGLLSAIN